MDHISTPLDRKEAAKYLGCSLPTLDRYREHIPHYRPSPGRICFDPVQLDLWKQQGGFAHMTPQRRPRLVMVRNGGAGRRVHPDLAWMYAS